MPAVTACWIITILQTVLREMPTVPEYVAVRAYLRGFPMLTTSSLFRQEGKGGERSWEICLVSRRLKKNSILSFSHFDCQCLLLPPPSFPIFALLSLFLHDRLAPSVLLCSSGGLQAASGSSEDGAAYHGGLLMGRRA